jgi:hypothetical protein
MKKIALTFTTLFLLVNATNAQKKSAKKINAKAQPITKKVVAEPMIRTNNADTLYFDLDNAIIITPSKKLQKTALIISATEGDIIKLSNNFYQLGNLKSKSVTITLLEEKTKKKVEEKTFIVSKQVLPF